MAHLEWILVALIGVVLGLLLLANTLAVMAIDNAQAVFEDLLGGRALPQMTQIVFKYRETGLAGFAATLLPISTLVYLVWMRRARASWYFSLGIIVLLIFHFLLIAASLWYPYLTVISLIGYNG